MRVNASRKKEKEKERRQGRSGESRTRTHQSPLLFTLPPTPLPSTQFLLFHIIQKELFSNLILIFNEKISYLVLAVVCLVGHGLDLDPEGVHLHGAAAADPLYAA
jgi:hypothetical protein